MYRLIRPIQGSAAAIAALSAVAAAQLDVAYLSALTEDSIVRLEDLNGDGDLNDAGESTIFFGPGNADSFPGVGSAQAIVALGRDDILAADGEESGAFFTAVYRLTDRNDDGDAMDLGEAVIWWDAVLPLPGSPNYDRPKDMTLDADGSVILLDNNTINFDNDSPEAIWHLDDADGDGDASDPGEQSLVAELAPIGSAFGFVSEEIEQSRDGRLLMTNLDSSTNPTNLWAVETDGSLTPIASSDDITGILWKEQGMALSPFTGNPIVAATDLSPTVGLIELVDLDGDGDAESEGEVIARYVASSSMSLLEWSFTDTMEIEAAPDGSLWLIDNKAKQILRFADLDGNENYQGPGEAGIIYDAALADTPTAFPRALTFAPASSCIADLNGDGILDFFDVGAFLELFTNGDPAADLNGDGVLDFFDVSEFLADYSVGCP